MKCVNGETPSTTAELPGSQDERGASADTTGFSSTLQTTLANNQPSTTFPSNQPSTSFTQHQPLTSANQQQTSSTTSIQQPITNTTQQQLQTTSNQQTLQVPHPPGRPSVPASARRGTNIAVSKRTRFALQVQKPTGEEDGSLTQSPSGGDVNGGNLNPNLRGRGRGDPARRSRSPGPRGRLNSGRQIMHSDFSQEVQNNKDLSLDRTKHGSLPRQDLGVLEGSRVVRGGGRGRAHNPVAHAGIPDHPRSSQLRQRFGKNGLPSHSQSGGSTDESSNLEFMQKGKSRWVKYGRKSFPLLTHRTLCYNKGFF